MSKKKQYTFANAAKDLQKKFPRREFDSLEAQDYKEAMKQLMAEQEAYKAENGLGTEKTQNYGQGLPQFDGKGNSILPKGMVDAPDVYLPGLNNPGVADIFKNRENAAILSDMNEDFDTYSTNLNDKTYSDIISKFPEKPTPKTSLIPSYVSAGSSILGNVAQMILDKKPNELVTPDYLPEQLDLSDEKLAARKDATTAGNVMRNNLRTAALNTGQAVGNFGVNEATIQRAKGDVLTKLGTAEKEYNTESTNRASTFNIRNKSRDNIINRQLKDAWKQRQLAYLSGAIGTVPSAMKDINQIKEQDRVHDRLTAKEKGMIELLRNSTRYNDFNMDLFGVLTGIGFGGQ